MPTDAMLQDAWATHAVHGLIIGSSTSAAYSVPNIMNNNVPLARHCHISPQKGKFTCYCVLLYNTGIYNKRFVERKTHGTLVR